MKNLELTSMGVQEMSTIEMKETDGGIIWLLVVAGALLLGTTSCTLNMNMQFGGQNNVISNSQTIDTSFNGNSVGSTLNGNSIGPTLSPGQK